MVRVLLGKLTLLVGQTLLLFDNPCIDLFNFSWCILYYAAFWCIAHIMVHSLYAVINVRPAGCFVTSLGLYYMSMKMITRAWPASCFVTRGDMLWHRAATATQGKAFNTSSWTHLCANTLFVSENLISSLACFVNALDCPPESLESSLIGSLSIHSVYFLIRNRRSYDSSREFCYLPPKYGFRPF